MIQDALWPTVTQGMVRVRFTGGDLSGAVIDLPETLADTRPGQLILAESCGIYDRADDCRPVRSARVLRAPASSRPVSTAAVCSSYL